MKTNILLSIGVIAVIGFIGCATKPDLNLNANTGRQVEGTYAKDGVSVDFASREVAPGKVELTLKVDSAVITASVDNNLYSSVSDGGGAVLTAAQKDVLNELALMLDSELARAAEPSDAEMILVNLVGYWSKAPEGYAIGLNVIDGSARAMGNEGIKCIKKGTWVLAQYTDSKGSHVENVLVGSTARAGYECMGRCGAGCGSSWIPSSWCKDCHDHDQCSNKNYSSGGASDANCGDEFTQAQDDWTWGVSRGCNGK